MTIEFAFDSNSQLESASNDDIEAQKAEGEEGDASKVSPGGFFDEVSGSDYSS